MEVLGIMVEDMLLIVFCALLAIGGISTFFWEAATGRIFDMDGLWLTLISLTIAAVFGGNIAWMIYTGDLKAILHRSKDKPK
jgi:hypothetical protein